MASTTIQLLLISPFLVCVFWHISSVLSPPPAPPTATLRGKAILLLIAHPDDESMFFSPTLLALTRPEHANHVRILCLSSGDADGLGDTRTQEIKTAANTLGLRDGQKDVLVLNDTRFKDGMKENWAPDEIADVLSRAFVTGSKKNNDNNNNNSSSKSKGKGRSGGGDGDGPTKPTVDVILTFDGSGVSSHPNHIALYHGARRFVKTLTTGREGHACPVTLYSLTTVTVLRKYAFVLDVLPTFVAGVFDDVRRGFAGATRTSRESRAGRAGPRAKRENVERVMFVSTMAEYVRARRAMVHGHRSQMVWFRWAWIGIGRYMVINDLRRVVV